MRRPVPTGSLINAAGLLRFHPLLQSHRFQYVTLPRPAATLGRDKQCDVAVDDPGVSRTHARFEVAPGQVRIVDESSANGVIVDGRKVSAAWLKGGEVIRLGDTFFRFFLPGLLPASAELEAHDSGLVSGPSLDQTRRLLTRAAGDELTVLMQGETGTGKDVAAQYLHAASARRDGPFVAVNCGAIPMALIESELFGHTRGAFTGAASEGLGLVRQAHGGTLFLDEIGELPFAAQSKLLRVLQERVVRPVGGTRGAAVDLRVVCATNCDLGANVRAGTFRADLFARVAELVIELPPLRDRIEDVPLLAQHFIDKHGQGRRALAPSAIEVLCRRTWPLNVRGLETAVRRALLLAGDSPTLEFEHFPEDALGDWIPGSPPAASPPATEPKSDGQADHANGPKSVDPRDLRLTELLRRHAGDVDSAAGELGLSRSQVYRRAKKAGIDPARFRR